MDKTEQTSALVQSESGDNTKIIEDLTTVRTQYMNNCKLLHLFYYDSRVHLRKNYKIDVFGDREIKTVFIFDSTVPDLKNPSIDAYDRCIMDAIFTLHETGITVFPADYVARIISGNLKQKTTPERRANIMAHIDKLSKIRVRIDWTDEYNKRNPQKPVDKKIIEASLLPIETVTAKFAGNGRYCQAYQLTEMPALYQYAKEIHQIINVPAEYLASAGRYSDTETAVIIKRYLVSRLFQKVGAKTTDGVTTKRIALFWYDREAHRYKGLIPMLGYDPESTEVTYRTTIKPRITKIVTGTLDSLKDQGVILDYQAYRLRDSTNRSAPVAGYEVILSNKGRKRHTKQKNPPHDKKKNTPHGTE